MSKYMLLFSLGPVQSFIAQARKTRDLWLGSFLLSTLMEVSMKGIESALVFPAQPIIKGNIPDLPNKYIAIFDTEHEAIGAAQKSEENIKECWNSISRDIWQRIIIANCRQSTVTTHTIWDRQTNPDTFFEIFWVVVAGEETEYAAWLKQTQEMLDARKRLRDFRLPYLPSEQEEKINISGEKSTISGEREALHGKEITPEAVRTFWKQLATGLSPNDINKDGEERLDAIDTVKRFAYRSRILENKQLDARFPSTSSIATASFVEQLIRKAPDLSSVREWLNVTKDPLDQMSPKAIPYLHELTKLYGNEEILKLDGDCYFPETFTAYRLKKDYGFLDDRTKERDTLARDGTTALTALLRETKERGIPAPTPYYAMIQMDGDKMGELLNNVAGETEHTAISAALSDFSRKSAPELVERNYPGRLIYAGGDDVFALAPLARLYISEEQTTEREGKIWTILDMVDQLQQKYCTTLKEHVGTEERKQKISASTGIAIAHHYTSLSFVRRASKAAEELAKEHYGRNALVVTVIRRSGEQTRVGCHWRYPGLEDDNVLIQPIALFSRFYQLIEQDILSPKCVHTLLDEAPALIGLVTEAQQSEIKRVLLRQRDEQQKDKLTNDEVKELAKRLVDLAAAMDKATDEQHKKVQNFKKSIYLHEDRPRYGLVETFGWLLVMAFLARKEQD